MNMVTMGAGGTGATKIGTVKKTGTISTGNSALTHAEMREDTAIQRQVADLKAAGLNPILATGYSGASSAAAVKYVDSEATTSMANSAEKNANANLINSVARLFTSALKFGK